VDVKCPSSGESAANDWRNLDRLVPHDEIKCVIGDRDDYDYARGVLARIQERAARPGVMLLSPVYGHLAPRELVAWILADRLPVRLNLQLHKYIWGPDERGV
jgi:7-carboxy-7-deazaguanine synthase